MRATTATIDYVMLILLLAVILTGIAPTIGINLFGHGYDYRTTVASWFRGLFSGTPQVQPIAHAPVVYRSRRAGPPAEPGTGGCKWRKIGVPY